MNIIICKENKIGGTGTVIDYISKKIEAKIILTKDFKFNCILNESDNKKYIAIQPTAIIKLLLFNLLKPDIRIYYIFDAHPFGFERNIISLMTKPILYWLSALLAWLFIDKKRIVIPDGPLKHIFPFSNFTVCSWDHLVKNKFKKKYSTTVNHSFLYYGTISKQKNIGSFLKFTRNNPEYRYKIIGLKDNSFTTDKYQGVFDGSNINCHEDILCWCSKYESYGLSFREYVLSGGSLIFLRKYNTSDRIKNSIYLNLSAKNINLNFIFKIKNKFVQEITLSNSVNLLEIIGN